MARSLSLRQIWENVISLVILSKTFFILYLQAVGIPKMTFNFSKFKYQQSFYTFKGLSTLIWLSRYIVCQKLFWTCLVIGRAYQSIESKLRQFLDSLLLISILNRFLPSGTFRYFKSVDWRVFVAQKLWLRNFEALKFATRSVRKGVFIVTRVN